MSETFTWVVSQHELSHVLVGLILMGLICPVLQAFRVRGFAWHAAIYVIVFFYAREAAQAERALKPALGDPVAFFHTLWPGNWTAGGARLSEWLAPTVAVLVAAALTPLEPFMFRNRREIRLPQERPDGV